MTNEQLVQYIAEERARGVIDESIRKELLNSGWREADVIEALSGSGSISTTPENNVGFFRRLPRGRIGRMRYFLGGLTLGILAVIPFFILILAWGVLGYSSSIGFAQSEIMGMLSTLNFLIPILMFLSLILVFLPLLYMNLMLAVRRLHDLNMSGWFVLVSFIPFIGPLFGLYMLFWPGTSTSNNFGTPPSDSRKFFDDLFNR
jgi:uncharacterized membrane protein YhaH (DUF805 family)